MAGHRTATKEETVLTGCEHGAQVRHGVGRGSAVRLTAEGAALCATPCEAEQRGPKT
ncbi:hypothetical protein [Xenorhabdus mauleonii]|uniref:hypothetical protein n=1 Tax=Xenorhabdus mauleonii TaxID=351675 RepID=UPI001587B572|nr:hypothetical protein [Xenorhabdus mauleonii]